MEFTLATMNVKRGLASAKRARGLLRIIKQANPDLAILSEGYYEHQTDQAEDVAYGPLRDLGYTVCATNLNDSDGRTDKNVLIGIHKAEKFPYTVVQPVHLAGRSALRYELAMVGPSGTQTTVTGVHLNDRSNYARNREIQAYLGKCRESSQPAAEILLGDLNAAYNDQWQKVQAMTTAIRGVDRICKAMDIPPAEPRAGRNLTFTTAHRRVASIAGRLSESLDGTSMNLLTAAGFADADEQRHPTFHTRIKVGQLDHILGNGLVDFEDFRQLPKGPSDHIGIMAKATIYV